MSTPKEPLMHLGYISRSTMLMRDAQLDRILDRARERNKARHVSGMLLYSDGSFLQVIEGSSTNVRDIFSIIKADSGHHKINVLFEEELLSRDFASWTMGFRRIDGDEVVKAPGMNHFLQGKESLSEFMVKHAKPSYLLKSMLNYFREAA